MDDDDDRNAQMLLSLSTCANSTGVNLNEQSVNATPGNMFTRAMTQLVSPIAQAFSSSDPTRQGAAGPADERPPPAADAGTGAPCDGTAYGQLPITEPAYTTSDREWRAQLHRALRHAHEQEQRGDKLERMYREVNAKLAQMMASAVPPPPMAASSVPPPQPVVTSTSAVQAPTTAPCPPTVCAPRLTLPPLKEDTIPLLWLEQVEAALLTRWLPADHIRTLLTAALQAGKYRDWWKFERHKFQSWDNFVVNFKLDFHLKKSDLELRREIDGLTHADDQELVPFINSVLARFGEMDCPPPPADQIRQVMELVRPTVQSALLAKNPRTLSDLVDYARTLPRLTPRPQPQAPPAKPQPQQYHGQRKQGPAAAHQASAPPAQPVPAPVAQSPPAQPATARGHVIDGTYRPNQAAPPVQPTAAGNYFQDARAQAASAQPTQVRRQPRDISKIECWNCNNFGHVARECPERVTNQPGEQQPYQPRVNLLRAPASLSLPIRIRNVPMDATLDTGSTYSLMSEDFFNSIGGRGLKLAPWTKPLPQAANSETVKPIGVFAVTISSHGYYSRVQFGVVPNFAASVLLGLDYQCKVGLVLDPRNGRGYFAARPGNMFSITGSERPDAQTTAPA